MTTSAATHTANTHTTNAIRMSTKTTVMKPISCSRSSSTTDMPDSIASTSTAAISGSITRLVARSSCFISLPSI